MQFTDNYRCIHHYQRLRAGRSSDRTSGASVDARGRLLVLVSAALLIAAGPGVLRTVTEASLVAIQIVFEVCHVGLVAYQLFGR
jgi:hypothetical protein